MSLHWLLLSFSWLGIARLQQISGNPSLNPINSYDANFNLFAYKNDYDKDQINDDNTDQFDHDVDSNRRTLASIGDRNWQPNLVDTDKTIYTNPINPDPYLVQKYIENIENNSTIENTAGLEKRSFSPWGGKRNDPFVQQTWSWKRESRKEPAMPKRVRFSPWGGKRSGQVLYKPGVKASKLIFSSSIPEMSKIISNYPSTGIRYYIDKRHPIRILTLSNLEGKLLRDAMPFGDFDENKYFKPGHTFTHIDMVKDGKLKVKKSFKFNNWSGKRTQPVIGPIWTPNQDDNEPTMNGILKQDPAVYVGQEKIV